MVLQCNYTRDAQEHMHAQLDDDYTWLMFNHLHQGVLIRPGNGGEIIICNPSETKSQGIKRNTPLFPQRDSWMGCLVL